jgi:hypothetical protein
MLQWLKDRKGRALSLEEIKRYCRIAASLSETIEIQKKIDEIFPETEHDIIRFEQPSSTHDLEKYSRGS